MREPSAGVPLPGGRPEPSGMMLISQAAISAGEIGFPRFGPCAKAALEPRMRAKRDTTFERRARRARREILGHFFSAVSAVSALNVICSQSRGLARLCINMFLLPSALDAPARG